MKTTIALILMLFAGWIEKPSSVPLKITELHTKNWYANKSQEWRTYLDQNPNDEESWMQYFLATQFSGDKEKLGQIHQQISDKFSNSFLSNYTSFKQMGWTKMGVEKLRLSLAVGGEKRITFEDQLVYAELFEREKRSVYSEQLFESGLIHSSTLNYSYNMLMSVAEDGLLIVNGLHLTVPLWILQDVMNIRKDVSILNLELAKNQSEYVNRILETKGWENSLDNLLNGKNGDRVYYALTLPKELIENNEKELYVVGLASTVGDESFNHFETLKTNIQNRFLLDYLSVDFNGEPKTATGKILSTNYIVPLLLLKEFYDDLNDDEQSKRLVEQIQSLAKDSQMETRVSLLLNKEKAPRNFKVVDVEVKELEKRMKPIKGNLYASEQELTNKDYWSFMEYLRKNGYDDLYNKYYQDISEYDEVSKSLMSRYHYSPINWKELDSKAKKNDLLNYPALDFTYEAAKAYNEWMTIQYNGNEKRKYKKVLFRLPTRDEWTMAALGYKTFQSWKLEENIVEAKLRGHKSPSEKFDLSKNEIKYPWGLNSWEMRNSISNKFDCYLANVNTGEKITCKAGIKGDGFSFTSPAQTYFANQLGLYDVIGNVAEMIDESGVAMGGSWNDEPENASITSSYEYEESDIKVGMRLFMEIIEE